MAQKHIKPTDRVTCIPCRWNGPFSRLTRPKERKTEVDEIGHLCPNIHDKSAQEAHASLGWLMFTSDPTVPDVIKHHHLGIVGEVV